MDLKVMAKTAGQVDIGYTQAAARLHREQRFEAGLGKLLKGRVEVVYPVGKMMEAVVPQFGIGVWLAQNLHQLYLLVTELPKGGLHD